MSQDQSYQFHEGSIALPEGCQDRTVNMFIYGDPERSPLNFNIARDDLQTDETLPAYVERQIKLLKSRLSQHKLLSRKLVQLGQGEAALTGEQIDATQKNGQRTFYQRQAAFLIGPQRALILSATAQHALDKAFDQIWDAWLASFQPSQH